MLIYSHAEKLKKVFWTGFIFNAMLILTVYDLYTVLIRPIANAFDMSVVSAVVWAIIVATVFVCILITLYNMYSNIYNMVSSPSSHIKCVESISEEF